MDETNPSSQKDFPEWMVTQALAAYLGARGKEDPHRMAWLFGLEAETPHGPSKLSDLCGFDWAPGKIYGGAEDAFKEDDRGKLSSDDFKKIYSMVTPDFRYCTNERDKHLIIEAKGTPKPIGQRDLYQANRYFTYLRDSGYKGAIIYFVPNPKNWLTWLTQTAREYDTPFGVLDIKFNVVPNVANELVRVVGKALVQTADLLGEALRF